MVKPQPLRIFLASPNDLADDRNVVRAAVDEYNDRRSQERDATFEVVGVESVRGTARRPQEEINELIGESHYLVALLKKSWGSEPGGSWGYTSGTEEELFTGLLELGQRDQPMRDVWVGFLSDPQPDPRIEALRSQMSTRHSMMYESIAESRDLKDKLNERLSGWAATAGQKIPRSVDLLPSSGKDVLRAANLRLRGEKLVELGHAQAGAVDLREAATLGGPAEHLAYARFSARSGELASAYKSTQKAIDYYVRESDSLYSPLAAEAFAAQAGVMRRQGLDMDAIGRLEQALTLLLASDAYADRVRCRVLDDLGLAHQKVGDLGAARQSFGEALEIRRGRSVATDICQSLVNMARLEVQSDRLELAATLANEAIEKLRGTPPSALHANAEILVAQVALRQSRPEEGVPHAERALALNRQISSKHGEAIALLLLTQCCRVVGRAEEAANYAHRCLEINLAMGNEQGAKQAQWNLDQLSQ